MALLSFERLVFLSCVREMFVCCCLLLPFGLSGIVEWFCESCFRPVFTCCWHWL